MKTLTLTARPAVTLTLAVLAATAALSVGRAADTMPSQTIAGIVASNPDFSTLLAAVKAAGLVDTLNGAGPFTVFAPTNEAFAKLPKGALDKLLADKEALKNVLLYHVVSGKVLAADVVKLTSAKAVNGASLKIAVMDKKVMVNDATVTKTDILASNGVIHVIDGVLLPPSK